MLHLPPLLLEILVASVADDPPPTLWPADDTLYAGYPYQWTVVLSVTPQAHSSPDTPTPLYYTGNDIKVGDWMSNAVGGAAWIIRSITSADSGGITCLIEDVDQFNTYADPNQSGTGVTAANVSGFIFRLDEEGQPILGPLVPNLITPQWQTDLIARFDTTNPPVTTALTGFDHSTVPTGEAGNLALKDGNLAWVPSTYVFTQSTPAMTWVITHNMEKFPNVDIVNDAGQKVEAEVDYNSNMQVTIQFAIAASGTAYLN